MKRVAHFWRFAAFNLPFFKQMVSFTAGEQVEFCTLLSSPDRRFAATKFCTIAASTCPSYFLAIVLKTYCQSKTAFKMYLFQMRLFQRKTLCFYPLPKGNGYVFVPYTRTMDIFRSMSVCFSISPTVWSHNQGTFEQNFMKLKINMYHNNPVMLKFCQTGFNNA